MQQVKIKDIVIGGRNQLVLIAGPCVIESEQLCLETGKRIKDIAAKFGIPYIFKSSFDKANRLSIESFRGPGVKKGLEVLKKVKDRLKLPVLTDIHCQKEIDDVARVADIIQIPAFLCRQTDIVLAAAKTGKAVNIKKGQFLAPWDMLPIVKKIEATGNKQILITERGVSFGYNNLVTDFRSLAIMRDFGYPVIYDAAHSVQLPGGQGKSSGGQRQFVEGLSRAAVAFGCDGLFLEVHPHPDKALCDGPNMISLKDLEKLLKQIRKIEEAV
ncbi:MAG: 3-deoxy-8-phosphooctulonate synthase [Candidatus Omnitrophica bacterium]|nr:3-deoxy-8-phosphooctulonate synthase [Candidatus Omnitrophota bacterium]